MRVRKKLMFLLVCMMVFVGTNYLKVNAMEASIRPLYVQSCYAYAYMNFNGNSAECVISIRGSSSISRISGRLSVYDETANRNMGIWYVNHNGYMYMDSRIVPVSSGHTYRLTFSGTAYNSNGTSEIINASVTKSK